MIKFMSEKECYSKSGFKVNSSDFRKTYCKCDVCALAKIKKFISHVNSERYSYWPGEFYYVDFSGPFEMSMQGNMYMVLFVDRATRLIVGIFVKNKNEDTAVEVMKKFIETNLSAPKFSGKDFIFVQSDNGEMHSEKVRLHSWANGIFQRFSSPHHSLSNGPVERAIKKVKDVGRCMKLEKKMPETFWEYAAKWAIYILNRTPNRFNGEWQRDATYQMFRITADYSRFRIPFSKAYVLKRPHEWKKDWREKGYKGILVGIDDSAYTVWVPELGGEVKSTNIIVDELATGELEQGEAYTKLSEKEIEIGNKKTYTTDDFAHLIGSIHTDNEDGLQYKVTAIREHRTRQGLQIVGDRVCLIGGHTDTIYARDVAAMTGAYVQPGDQSAAASPGPDAACERTVDKSTSALDRLFEDACESGNVALVEKLLAQGANPNFEVSTRIQPGKSSTDPQRVSGKRQLEGMDSGEGSQRRSSRLNKIKPINFNLTQFTLVESYQVDGEVKSYYIPKTYAQAIACEDSALWIAAMEKELKGLENAGCFEVEVLPDGANPIPSKWVFTVKTDSLGNVVCYKARLVAGGHRQIEGIDFTETFSPTVSWNSVRLFLALTVTNNLIPLQLDIDMAYLYGDIEPGVTIFMRPPQGINLPGSFAYRLKKSLYGLKQAGRIWNTLIDDKLKAVGFIALDEDACVYIRRRGKEVTLLLLYVDDIICSASDKSVLEELVLYLRSLFSLKLMGVPTTVSLPIPTQLLGLELIWGEGFKSVQINASKLVKELLRDHYKDSGSRSHRVPADPTFKFSKQDVLIDNGKLSNSDKDMQKAYRSIVGVTIFLVTTCRVDLSYVSTQLARYMSKPGWKHYRAAQYMLSYLSDNIDLGIAFYSSGNHRIYAYADSDFGSDESRRACAGYVFILANGPIRWKCAFSQEVPLSTCEAEVRVVSAMLEPIKTSIWINRVLESIGLGESYTKGVVQIHSSIDGEAITPFTVYEDNKAAIAWSSNSVLSQKMRHVERNLLYVRQEVLKKTFQLVWVETANQVADLFTKALSPIVYWRFVNMLMISGSRYREEYDPEEDDK